MPNLMFSIYSISVRENYGNSSLMEEFIFKFGLLKTFVYGYNCVLHGALQEVSCWISESGSNTPCYSFSPNGGCCQVAPCKAVDLAAHLGN